MAKKVALYSRVSLPVRDSMPRKVDLYLHQQGMGTTTPAGAA
jgi:hypothetical protein